MNDTKLIEREDVREIVRQKYGAAAQIVLEGRGEACCGTGNIGTGKSAKNGSCCGGDTSRKDAITSNLYDLTEAAEIPEDALLASLGCGNPTALAQLKEGEIVLDLGSGGGIDVLLSAKRVGPAGWAFGLDMTDQMLALAEKNKGDAGVKNATFLKGHIEDIPLPANSVDVIISNCVINLSGDKDAVLREAFRVLKPGGRFAVSDVVVEAALPDAIRKDIESYVGCVAGALEKEEYLAKLQAAGFVEASIEPTRRYTFADIDGTACCTANIQALSLEEKESLDGRVFSGFIRASKPVESNDGPCCGSTCCTSEARE
jgi:ubiquinone/menaquinone biosynthesis C-methylase UbiE